MTSASTTRHTGRWVAIIVAVLAVVLVVAGTKVVPDGEEPAAAGGEAFDKATYGPEHFPEIQKAIEEQAVDAPELAEALEDDPEGTSEEYGQEVDGNTVYSTTFTGTIGKDESGVYDVEVDGMPKGVTIRVQTGPAINGTELRDATGTVEFGQFTNQIEFQDAGAALNDEMKKEVIEPLDTDDLKGKKVTITGAFTAINPEAWLVTPVSMEVG
jgi:predicted lipoprotein